MDNLPEMKEIEALCPDIPREFIENHVSSLAEDYFTTFSREEIQTHLRGLFSINPGQPVQVHFSTSPNGMISCTVLAHDYPGVFSIITGLLSASGFDIHSGRIFTYIRKEKQQARDTSRGQQKKYGYRRHSLQEKPKDRKIIDLFTGYLMRTADSRTWQKELKKNLEDLFSLAAMKGDKGIDEAREKVTSMVVSALDRTEIDPKKSLYPLHIDDVDIGDDTTRISVIGEDTPFFLYALSNALSLHDISIEKVQIKTDGTRIEDKIEFTDLKGNPVADAEKINSIKLSILMTKQFTFFLNSAPDPSSAFRRFENLIQEIEKTTSHQFLNSFLQNPKILKDIARLLGASDFLWADFLRNQYEQILPLLGPKLRKKQFSSSTLDIPGELDKALKKAGTREEEIMILNKYKDQQIYLIDLDHILSPDMDFQLLSNKLTFLAETIVNKSVALSWKYLKKRYGTPVTVGGLDVSHAIFGLGKLGGAALGYASDIELLFVYSDNGRTDGKNPISNADFFEKLFRESIQMIKAKREGIFHVDLRLRPYGRSGPIACSLDNFVRYFGKGGDSHSFERLALIRMRAIGGDHELGNRIERIRDEIIYSSEGIDVKSLRQLRLKQLKDKTVPGKLNAKFSPGGLVDLEYSVQILQCIHGKTNLALRTPKIHVALEELAKAGVMSPKEAEDLTLTYYFFRRLINGLRMLRGNAKDLFLPPVGSDEYAHLARRSGYVREGNRLSPSEQLYLDFETRAAIIRVFVESHLGRDSIPGPPVGNAADLVLSDNLPEHLQAEILSAGGFKNPARAYVNCRALAGEEETRKLFARLAILSWEIFKTSPDPDMALNNWERFISGIISPEDHFRQLLSQPKRIEILLKIFAGSQFLSDTLIKNPDFFEWVSDPVRLHIKREKAAIEADLDRESRDVQEANEWSAFLRRFRKREILRIGTRDLCLGKSIQEVVLELSNAAEAILSASLKHRWGNGEIRGFAVCAFGKLGGAELNYSSDIDLLGIYDPSADSENSEQFKKHCTLVMGNCIKDLSRHTEEGYVYRVDMRLRPYGKAGGLVHSFPAVIDYYQKHASLWEYLALLRLRPVAGDRELGERFFTEIRGVLLKEQKGKEIVSCIEDSRLKAVQASSTFIQRGIDVKNGRGGIRDIEFLVQGLMLILCRDHIPVLSGNTLEGLAFLGKEHFLSKDDEESLVNDYLFLRRLEHFLQIFEDRQTHILPRTENEREILSKRISGSDVKPQNLFMEIDRAMERVHSLYEKYLFNPDYLR